MTDTTASSAASGPETGTPGEPPATPPVPPSAPPAPAAPPVGDKGSAEDTEGDADELPAWARKKLTAANSEAAKYRTEKNDAVAAAKEATAAEYTGKVSELSASLDEANLRLLKLETALSVEGLPAGTVAEFADLLKGTNADELKAHAEKVKGLLGIPQKSQRPVDHSQGAQGGEKPDPGPGLNRLMSAYAD